MLYSSLMNYKCACPDCEHGYGAVAHHIVPLSKGGADKYWNMICLCSKCHVQRHYHSQFERHKTTLYTWKCLQELEHFGFTLDENDEDFYENLAKALKYSDINAAEI